MKQLCFEERLALEVDCRLLSFWSLVFLAGIVDEQAELLGGGGRLAYARGYHRHDFGRGNPFAATDDALDLELVDVWSQVASAIDWPEQQEGLLPMLLRLAYLRGWMDASSARPFGGAPEGYPDALWLPA